jgi:hypothetical protein
MSGEMEAGKLVIINGLESEAGKAMNGGSGMILGPQKDNRYPVLLYSLLADKVVKVKRSI